ncbi:MAG TPA: hypothetical protein VFV65_05480, partial [Gemmatimonadales bacterium]|nr:hypothetical protein [Gemmatimonadales bacterium]
FVALMESGDTAIRHAAQLAHGRTLIATGSYQAALATLDGLEGPEVDAMRAAAYAGLGDLAAALPLLDSAIARKDLTLPWDSTLAGIGRVDPALASQYTTAVAALPGLPVETRDRLLDADGMRLLAGNPDAGLARLAEAGSADPVTDASLIARLHVAQYLLAQADTFAGLEAARPGLTSLSEVGGPSSIQAIRYLRVMDRLRGFTDSISPSVPQGDLATFVMAESVRDGLPAPGIAAQLFATLAAWWPASPYAPKALLALAALQPASAASIFEGLECDYPDSPYLLLVAGNVTPAVLALEDSLRVYSVGAPPAAGGARRAPAAGARAGQTPRDELK